MKKLLSLFLFLFSLVIVGCKKESSYIEFKTDNIVMEYNSIYKVEYEVFGDVKNISFSVLDEEIVTFENDILTAHKDGETVLTCTYNKKEQVDINVKVLERGKQYFEVGDPSLNEANYQLLKEDLDSFSETLNESNYLSMDIATSVNGQKAVQSVRAINDPFYIEALIGDEYQIIAQEGNKVFSYTQVYSNYFERDYLGTVDKYEGSNSQEDSEEILKTNEIKQTIVLKVLNGLHKLNKIITPT